MLKFELTEQMVAVIGQALGNMPYNVAKPIVEEIQRQIDEQKTEMKESNRDDGIVLR